MDASMVAKATYEIEQQEMLQEMPEYWGIKAEAPKKKRRDSMSSLKRTVQKAEKAFREFFDSQLDELDVLSPQGDGMFHVEA